MSNLTSITIHEESYKVKKEMLIYEDIISSAGTCKDVHIFLNEGSDTEKFYSENDGFIKVENVSKYSFTHRKESSQVYNSTIQVSTYINYFVILFVISFPFVLYFIQNQLFHYNVTILS